MNQKSNEAMTLKVIAHIRTAFPTKFGIPRQSGLVDSLRGEKISATSGWCGSFRARCGIRGRRRCARPAWAATPGWACSPPARPSGPTPWAFPA